MLRLDALTRRFGDVTAVDGISFEVGRGETFGLLGPNGAGKTTLMHMIIGVLDPDEGSSTLDGDDTRATSTRARLGIAPQSLAVYDDLTAEENLRFFGRLYGMSGSRLRERIDWALDFAGLEDRRHRRVRTFSGGMKRRLNLVGALVHGPRLVLLDEPTVGVDPQSRHHLHECIEQLRREDVTILYTTHDMGEAQRLCDRIAIVDHGRLLALDTVDALLEAHGGHAVFFF
ncbi:MAG: ABC transporter ATP-binding protein, partial [Phycisphaerales bacterium]|nr:ABC transporter ATP-binding protein [Phycisphaerales bacterium]